MLERSISFIKYTSKGWHRERVRHTVEAVQVGNVKNINGTALRDAFTADTGTRVIIIIEDTEERSCGSARSEGDDVVTHVDLP